MAYTVREFAEKHGRSPGCVYWHIHMGHLRVQREGGSKAKAGRVLVLDESWPELGPGGSPTHGLFAARGGRPSSSSSGASQPVRPSGSGGMLPESAEAAAIVGGIVGAAAGGALVAAHFRAKEREGSGGGV